MRESADKFYFRRPVNLLERRCKFDVQEQENELCPYIPALPQPAEMVAFVLIKSTYGSWTKPWVLDVD